MILENFLVLTKTGLYCRYGNFYLDPQQPVADAVISHAHGDHAVSGSKNVYCTKPTAMFMEHRYRRNAAAQFFIKTWRETFRLGEVTVSFISAGHILGSAQVIMEHRGIKYLYTGDYKIEPDPTCEPVDFVEADVLITESTFADPETSHPDPVAEVLKLNAVDHNIMLGAYALGKSQRMIALINRHCNGKQVLLHHSIVPFCKIYEQFGIEMGDYKLYDRKQMKQTQHNIYLVPPMVFNSYYRAVNVVRAFVTGWKHKQQNGLQLLISDHADWPAILETIEQVRPKEVWTLHGDGKHLKQHFEGRLTVKILN